MRSMRGVKNPSGYYYSFHQYITDNLIAAIKIAESAKPLPKGTLIGVVLSS